MLSIWVQALDSAGCAASAWLGVTEPQVPSAKGLTEPLMNNWFFLFLLSFFQCQHVHMMVDRGLLHCLQASMGN